jgi:hypothetical protein
MNSAAQPGICQVTDAVRGSAEMSVGTEDTLQGEER